MIHGLGACALTVDQNLRRKETGDNAPRRSIPSLHFFPWEPPSLRGVQNGLLSFDEEGQDGEAEALNTD